MLHIAKPFEIKDGLLLEDRGVWLKWGATQDDLFALVPSNVLEWPNERRFDWVGVRCLGGLFADVHVNLETSRRMRQLGITLRTQEGSVELDFDVISKHLRRVFGSPKRTEQNDYAMVQHEEFVTERYVVFHYGNTEEYLVRHHGNDRCQSMSMRLRNDCDLEIR